MGYTTTFTGAFKLNQPLTEAQAKYLETFCATRRMARKAPLLLNAPDPVRVAAGLPVGPQGGYYVGSPSDYGQTHTPDIIDFNNPPSGQPGLWCHWAPTADRNGIEWDGGEKFYYYTEWLEYVIEHFLKPWGLVLSGEVEWSGEESGDLGKLVIKNNAVKAVRGRVVYGREK